MVRIICHRILHSLQVLSTLYIVSYFHVISLTFIQSKISNTVLTRHCSIEDGLHKFRNWERDRAVSFLGYLFRIFVTVHLQCSETEKELTHSKSVVCK
jgi:hypothetical protein